MLQEPGAKKPEVLDLLSRVNDSKQLTEQQRESLFEAEQGPSKAAQFVSLSPRS